MSRILGILFAPLLALCFSSCASSDAKLGSKSLSGGSSFKVSGSTSKIYKVKTTAYCHQEGDSLRYGRGSATGNVLKYGVVRSAAADWSVFPVGTVFRIVGDKFIYQVDDYGRALVGTKPSIYTGQTSRKWVPGVAGMWTFKFCDGDPILKALGILTPRASHPHVQMMVSNILKKTHSS